MFGRPTAPRPQPQPPLGNTCWLAAFTQMMHAWGYRCDLNHTDFLRMAFAMRSPGLDRIVPAENSDDRFQIGKQCDMISFFSKFVRYIYSDLPKKECESRHGASIRISLYELISRIDDAITTKRELLSSEERKNYTHWLTVSWDMTFPNNEHPEQKEQLLNEMNTRATLEWIDDNDDEVEAQAKRDKNVRVMADGYEEQEYYFIKVNFDLDTEKTDVTDKLRDHNETLRDTYLKFKQTQTPIYFESPVETYKPPPCECLYDIGIIHQGTLEKGQIVVETKFDGSKTTDELVKLRSNAVKGKRADWFEAKYKFQRFQIERYFVDPFCRAMFVSLRRGVFSNIPTRICLPVHEEHSFAVFELTCIACGAGHGGGHWWAYRKYNDKWFSCNDNYITPAGRKIPEGVQEPRLLLYSRIDPDLQDKLNFVRHRPLSKKEKGLKDSAFKNVTKDDTTFKTKVLSQFLRGSKTKRLSQTLRGKDFFTLKNKKWLNDDIVNTWVQLLLERSRHLHLELDGQNDCFMHSQYFMLPTVKDGNYNESTALRHCNRRCNNEVASVSDIDRIFFPVYTGGNHWYLIIIFVKTRAIKCFDSSNSTDTTEKSNLINRQITPWLNIATGLSDPPVTITFVPMPQQTNGYDCGVFLCAALDYASALPADTTKDTTTWMKFEQDDMPHFRERMACRLMQGERSLIAEGTDAGITSTAPE